MTSAVDICNRSLAEIGARATIASLDEASKEAANCKFFYGPLVAQMLRAAPWGFARKQIVLSELGNLPANTSPYPWLMKYAYPSDCQKLRYIIQAPINVASGGVLVVPGTDQLVFSTDFRPSRANRFLISVDGNAKVILSNVQYAIGVYTAEITNPELFDSLFTEALVMALAAKLVFPLTGDVSMKSDYVSLAKDAVLQARVPDGNEAVPSVDHTPDWIVARGITPAWGQGQFMLGEWYTGWDNNMSWGM